MTVKEPQEDQLLPSDSAHDVRESEPSALGTPRRQPGEVRPRVSKSDYRLRGLDLDAPALLEAKPRLFQKSHPSRRRRRRRLVLQWTVVLAILATTAAVLRVSVVRPYSVRSTSMVPTLNPGTSVLVLRPKLLTGSMKAGDLVVFHRPAGFECSGTSDPSAEYLKRVIATPGQTIWSASGRVYVDGQLLNESGWYNPPFGELGPSEIAQTVVPAGSYFVLGDNRTDPCDSRAFGPIAGSTLVGKVLATTTRGGRPSVHFF
jgi:signal peptidase I